RSPASAGSSPPAAASTASCPASRDSATSPRSPSDQPRRRDPGRSPDDSEPGSRAGRTPTRRLVRKRGLPRHTVGAPRRAKPIPGADRSQFSAKMKPCETYGADSAPGAPAPSDPETPRRANPRPGAGRRGRPNNLLEYHNMNIMTSNMKDTKRVV